LHIRGNKVIISGCRKGHLAKTLEANPGSSIELDVTDPESIRRAAIATNLIGPSVLPEP
jgi:uncharacterized oxidoreductase